MRRIIAVLVLSAFSSIAAAQAYPSRPVTIIVPFAAGGPTDIIARISGEYFSKTLGQQFVVENVAGAGGTTGITRGAGQARRLHHHDGPHGHARRCARAVRTSSTTRRRTSRRSVWSPARRS